MQNSGAFLSILVGLLLVSVVVQWFLIIGLNRRFTRQTKMLRQFFNGPNGEDLEALLTRNLSESREALTNSQIALARAEEVAIRLSGSIQHFALLRYDAFDDVTGQQSFSLALLDGRDNGAVVSAIFGRHNSRCFGKMIVDGQPEQPLTQEEKQVLMQALEQKLGARPEKGTRNGKNGSHKVTPKTPSKSSNGHGTLHHKPKDEVTTIADVANAEKEKALLVA